MKLGAGIPKMTLLDQAGKPVKLGDFAGKTLVLYFYPKDMTSGCTLEAEQFRDHIDAFKKKKAVVVGVSPDSVASHGKFCTKYDLPFTLLSDPEHRLAEKFGVWVEKSLYGRKYMGIARTTFVFGKDGKLAHVFEKVKPDGHAAAVLKVI
ncbi:thioredoxin-dependent thiol peroxidase [Candidatus Kaiserbacteria bacterium]|nr:thioredoxin-dependent thiol peroxidase [Candidatus Kaiserbacteria bacterium]